MTAQRLKLPGHEGWPSQDELPYLAAHMGAQVRLSSACSLTLRKVKTDLTADVSYTTSYFCSSDHQETWSHLVSEARWMARRTKDLARMTKKLARALYQRSLHAPVASFRRNYACTVGPFSENNACTGVFYLLSQRRCRQKPLRQAQARISSILADTRELSSSLALSKGLEVWPVFLEKCLVSLLETVMFRIVLDIVILRNFLEQTSAGLHPFFFHDLVEDKGFLFRIL